MEGRKKKSSSSPPPPPPPSPSSLTSQLFGSRENPNSPSSSAIFESIFTSPSMVPGRESMKQQETVNSNTSGVDRFKEHNENLGSTYQDQRVQPCHLSSSIYYGGPDLYFQPQNPSIDSTNKKDGGEDDSGIASRGNWWQGSLYY